ncbi:hypothetical protein AGLY_005568 [Aphis glycines]|uniref:Uncharacterized protein n=1 Tax=Aphis glycines TaxID=307491 RepID=A0A6G0TT47_APHGL|nr:hypothetical protein AGLY_005568 [Aphis glycines]
MNPISGSEFINYHRDSIRMQLFKSIIYTTVIRKESNEGNIKKMYAQVYYTQLSNLNKEPNNNYLYIFEMFTHYGYGLIMREHRQLLIYIHFIFLTARFFYVNQPMRRVLCLNVLKDHSKNTKPNDSDHSTIKKFKSKIIKLDVKIKSIIPIATEFDHASPKCESVFNNVITDTRMRKTLMRYTI